MRASLIAAALLLLTAYFGNAQAQSPSDVSGLTPDLNIRIVDLSPERAISPSRSSYSRFAVVDLGGKPVEMAGKTEALNVKETATEIRIELAADALFDFDKADIRQDAASALHQVADIIRDKGRGCAVRIEGHTDAKGSDAYNQKLSDRRAQSVQQWLAQKEELKGRMATQGFGAKKPVAPNTKPDGSDDPDGRQKNRRVEIVLAK